MVNSNKSGNAILKIKGEEWEECDCNDCDESVKSQLGTMVTIVRSSLQSKIEETGRFVKKQEANAGELKDKAGKVIGDVFGSNGNVVNHNGGVDNNAVVGGNRGSNVFNIQTGAGLATSLLTGSLLVNSKPLKFVTGVAGFGVIAATFLELVL